MTNTYSKTGGPTLAAVICNYNHSQFLRRALDAIVLQGRPPNQFIILDDCSTDDSLEIIRNYALVYPYIQVIENTSNLGLLQSLKTVIPRISSDYVYFGASDDYILPGFFEKAMTLASNVQSAGVLCGQMIIHNHKSEPVGTNKILAWANMEGYFSPRRALKEYLIPQIRESTHSLTSATIYNFSGLLDEGGFKHELEFWCDTFLMRTLMLKYGILYIDKPFAVWHSMPGSFSSSSIANPFKTLTIAARLYSAMSTQSNVFPASYVKKWYSIYRSNILRAASMLYASEFLPAFASLKGLFDSKSSLPWRVVRALLWRILVFYSRVTQFCAWLYLRSYDVRDFSD